MTWPATVALAMVASWFVTVEGGIAAGLLGAMFAGCVMVVGGLTVARYTSLGRPFAVGLVLGIVPTDVFLYLFLR